MAAQSWDIASDFDHITSSLSFFAQTGNKRESKTNLFVVCCTFANTSHNIKRKLYLPPPLKTFLKSGEEKATARQLCDSGELALAKDWVMFDDLGEKHLIMPTEVTHLRPDIFLYSLNAK